MSFPRPSQFPHRLSSVVRAVLVGSVLSAVPPVHATGTVDVQRAPLGQTLESPGAWVERSFPASILDAPVDLRVRAPDSAPSHSPENGSMVLRDVAAARPAGISRPAVPVRPAVTILAPTDPATIPAGILRVRGTVSAPGEKVRVRVNGVRAVVQSGTFTAAVRVTPHTMILSAVATTSKGLIARHQIGLVVTGSRENGFRLRPFPRNRVVARALRFPLQPSVPWFAPALGGDGEGDAPAAGPGGPRFMLGESISHDPPAPATSAVGAAEGMRLVLVPASPDGRGSRKEPGLREKRLPVNAEATRNLLVMHPEREYRAQSISPNGHGAAASTPAGIGAPTARSNRDSEIAQNPRGMPLGPEYSFGVIFIFDAEGYWRVRWY